MISCCTSRAGAAWLSPWLQLLIKNKRGGDGWQAMHSIAAPEPLDLRALRLARMSNVEIKFSAPLGGRDLGHDSCSFQSTSLAALRCWKWEMQPRGDPSLTRLFHPRPHLGSSWFAEGGGRRCQIGPRPAWFLTPGQLEAISERGEPFQPFPLQNKQLQQREGGNWLGAGSQLGARRRGCAVQLYSSGSCFVFSNCTARPPGHSLFPAVPWDKAWCCGAGTGTC